MLKFTRKGALYHVPKFKLYVQTDLDPQPSRMHVSIDAMFAGARVTSGCGTPFPCHWEDKRLILGACHPLYTQPDCSIYFQERGRSK